MRSQASRTAEYLALFRALESVRRGDALFVDRFAARFLPRTYRVLVGLAGLPIVGRAVPAYVDWRLPTGPRITAAVRTRVIDDLVVDAVTAGASQVLILGAGFDSRAFRMRELSKVHVFEVDHPATQAAKRDLLEGVVDATATRQVTFVPVDLDRQRLGDGLAEAGFAMAETVVILEGLTNYLTASAVDEIFRWLSATLPAASRVIFSYVDQSVLANPSSVYGLDRNLATLRRSGEPWTFGLDPAQTPAYVGDRGMSLMLDTSAYDAADALLRPLRRHNNAARYYRIAQAVVVV